VGASRFAVGALHPLGYGPAFMYKPTDIPTKFA